MANIQPPNNNNNNTVHRAKNQNQKNNKNVKRVSVIGMFFHLFWGCCSHTHFCLPFRRWTLSFNLLKKKLKRATKWRSLQSIRAWIPFVRSDNLTRQKYAQAKKEKKKKKNIHITGRCQDNHRRLKAIWSKKCWACARTCFFPFSLKSWNRETWQEYIKHENQKMMMMMMMKKKQEEEETKTEKWTTDERAYITREKKRSSWNCYLYMS